MNQGRWLVVLGIGSLLGTSIVEAQRKVAAETVAANVEQRAAVEILDRVVSVSLRNVSLDQALDTLGALAKTQIGYRKSVLVPFQAQVSVVVNEMTLGQALREVLAGTSLRVMPSEGGLVVRDDRVVPQVVVQGTIIGKVINAKTKQPIVGATVTIGGAEKRVTTADDGMFQLSLEGGEHRMEVRAVGMVRQQKTIVVENGKSISVEFVLEPSASVLEEVVVTGTVIATSRKAIANPITVITGEDIERRGITRVDQLLRGEVPGVIAIDRGSHNYTSSTINVTAGGGGDFGRMEYSEVYARGSSALSTNPSSTNATGGPNPLKTYVDGVELLDPSALGTIDPQTIDRIEIVTGPQAATVYGSGAMGGVMQIFTKKGAGASGTNVNIHVGYGIMENNFNAGRTPTHNDRVRITGGAGPAFSYSMNGSYAYSGQWLSGLWSRRLGGSFGFTHTRTRATLNGAISVTSGKNGTADATLGGSPRYLEKARSGEWSVPSQGYARYTSNRVARSLNQNTSLNGSYRLTPRLHGHVAVGSSQSSNHLVSPSPQYARAGNSADTLYLAKRATGRRTTAALDVTSQFGSPQGLSLASTVGASGSWGERNASSGCLVTKVATTYIPCGSFSAQQGVGVIGMLDDKSWGGFGSFRVGLWDRLFLTFGLRGEKNKNYGRDHNVDWTPTNGVAYTMTWGAMTVKLLGSYGQATRPPKPEWGDQVMDIRDYLSPSEFEIYRENRTLRPEVSRGPQGGFEIYYGNTVSVTLNRYRQNVTDLIQAIVVDSTPAVWISSGRPTFPYTYQYNNVASIHQHGWETTASMTLGAVQVKGAYTWMDSRITSVSDRALGSASSMYPGMTFLNIPNHIGNVTVTYAKNATSVSIVSNYVGSANRKATELSDQFQNLRVSTYSARVRNVEGEYVSQGYVKSDIAISHRVSAALSLIVNVNNVGNSFGNDYSLNYPALGRQSLIGAQYRLSW